MGGGGGKEVGHGGGGARRKSCAVIPGLGLVSITPGPTISNTDSYEPPPRPRRKSYAVSMPPMPGTEYDKFELAMPNQTVKFATYHLCFELRYSIN
jgi:hypothetical protein